MDPLPGILVTANLLAVVDNLYRGIRLVRHASQDPTADGFNVRFITEKARYAEWKRRIGIETSDDVSVLISKLSEEAQREVPLILKPMQKYVKLAEQLFVKHGISTSDTVNSHLNFRDKLRRIDLMMDEQQHLNDILDTLKNCNDGLLTIAPPPRGYHVSLAGNDLALETLDEAQYTESDAPLRPQPPQSTLQPLPSPMNDRSPETTPQNTSTPTIKTPAQESTQKVFQPVIELLYSTCLGVLRSMVVQYPNSRGTFQDIGDRLQIWGTGLFQGQVSIDQALDQPSSGIRLLRNNITGILADVAVILRKRFPFCFNHRGLIYLELLPFMPISESSSFTGMANTLNAGHTLSILGEADTSASILQLRELFSIPEISLLPLESPSFTESIDEALEESVSLDSCSGELAALVESLFWTLSTTEMVLKDTIAHQKKDPAINERDIPLLKSNSESSLPDLAPGYAKDLLRIDLQGIADLQNSLKDSEFEKYMEHKSFKFDKVQLHKELEEEARQLRYWTSMLKESTEKQSMTKETRTAMIFNLMRIARTFGESDQKNCEGALNDAQQPHACPSFIVPHDSVLTTIPNLQLLGSDRRRPTRISIMRHRSSLIDA